MQPAQREQYENGNVGLIIDTMPDDTVLYWVRVGTMMLQLTEDDIIDLQELLIALEEDWEEQRERV